MQMCVIFPFNKPYSYSNVGIGLEPACGGGSCRGISIKRDKCYLHLKGLPTLASVVIYM